MKRLLTLVQGALLIVAGLAVVLGAPSTAAAAPCSPTGTETVFSAGYSVNPPDGRDWYVASTRTVVDQPAYDETTEPAVDRWYHWVGIASDPGGTQPPALGWIVDGGDHSSFPSTINTTIQVDGEYYYHAVADAVVVHHDAVTHREYQWALDIATTTCGDNGGGTGGNGGGNNGGNGGSDACSNLPGDQPAGTNCAGVRPGTISDTDSSTSYQCGNDYATVTSNTTRTPWVLNAAGTAWVHGQTNASTTTSTVDHSVEACAGVEAASDTASTGRTLPEAGGPSALIALAALALLGLGAGLVRAGRRRA